jgi:hypothetical protein
MVDSMKRASISILQTPQDNQYIETDQQHPTHIEIALQSLLRYDNNHLTEAFDKACLSWK